METSDYELYERMIQMEFGIDTKEIEKKYDEARGCDEEFISRVDKIVKNWDGIVNVVYRIGIHEIIPYISALKEVFNKDVGALIIDYLGLIKHPTAKTDYQKITDVMQELKELALSLMIPVLNFSTTGREEVKDKKKRLSLFSGKGSGEIEGSSQIVITMERVNELEGVVADDVVKAVQRQETDILEAIIQKKKQGKYAKILVELNKESLLMSEYIKPPNIQEERKPF
jgi:replicative DNA helicase